MDDLTSVLLVALCYWAYNSMLFAAYGIQTGARPSKWLSFGLTFIVNYILFFVISLLELPLAANWALIALALVVEVRLLYGCGFLLSLLLGLSGAVFGLAVNILSRSALSAILGLPLGSFDALLATPHNIRALSVGTAFLLGAALLRAGQPLLRQRKYRYLNRSVRNLYFALGLVSVQFVYLLLTLLIYSLPANELILKLWGIKTGACVLLGCSIGLWYAVRESGLEYFEEKSNRARQKLVTYRERERALEEQAHTDELTGCRSRSYGKEALEERIRQKAGFALCFVDINGLKTVNDALGHSQGNRYIVLVAHALADILEDGRDVLCRFGGDEFFLLLHNRDEEEAERLLADVAGAIESLSWSTAYPFECSISYGIARGDGETGSRELLRTADERMYARKIRSRAGRADPQEK